MKKTTLYIALFVLGFQTYHAQGQAVKYVLFEHFTQASCPPCAQQNPGFQNVILKNNEGIAHHIAYHTSWPGTDPMNVYSASDVANRVTYYGVTGVPTMQMLGKKWTGQPGGVTQSMVNNEAAGTSPISVAVSQTSDGTDRYVQVKVHTVGTAPSGTFILRTAVVESDISYPSAPGTNGEKDFPNVMRKMIPGPGGDAITLAPQGDSIVLNYTYTLDQATWDTSKIYVIAFVQEEVSGEVINSGSTNDPSWGILGSGTSFAQGEAGSPDSLSAQVFNSGLTAGLFRIKFIKDHPAGWDAAYVFQSNVYTSDSVDVTIAANTMETLDFSVTPGTTPGIGDYTVIFSSLDDSTFAPRQYTFHVMSEVTDLIVNNAAGLGDGSGGDASNWEGDYINGLIAAGNTSYGVTDHTVLVHGFKANALQGVYCIYLNIGWTFPNMNDELILELSAFLDGGGRLLIAGQDVGWDVWEGYGTPVQQAFYTNYMGANYIADLAPTPNNMMVFNPADAIFGSGTSSTIVNYYGGNYFYPDQIAPLAGAEAIFFYNGDSTNIGGVRHDDGNFRVVYLGVGLEMVGDVNVKNEIMKTTYDWFWGGILCGAISATAVNASCGLSDGSATANTTGNGNVYLWDDPGAQTTATATGLAAGIYSVTITDIYGCALTTNIPVNDNGGPTVTSQAVDNSCSDGTNGAINLIVSGGSSPYVFEWSNGDNTQTISGLATGDYTVTVTDNSGCKSFETITIGSPDPIVATAAIGNSTGIDDGSINLSVSGGTPGYAYSWDNGSSTEDISGLAPGAYIVTITDGLGCIYTDSFMVQGNVGIDAIAGSAAISVHPNPFNHSTNVSINLKQPANTTISLYDVAGRQVYFIDKGLLSRGLHAQEIEASKLPGGIYFLQVSTPESVLNEKLIINK
ncbi:MAG: T9SS type A sorting domain-containing protein [Flavobacteriales bacterium]|nr:T9SS type A sorting domain-containing protein [Flavobacteriales bacterium]